MFKKLDRKKCEKKSCLILINSATKCESLKKLPPLLFLPLFNTTISLNQ